MASHKRERIVDERHSSLSSFERRDVEKEFRVGERRIVIETIGFGLVFKVVELEICDIFALRRTVHLRIKRPSLKRARGRVIRSTSKLMTFDSSVP